MSRLWPILFSITFFSACIGNPEVEILDDNQLLLSYKELAVVYNKDDGGWVGPTQFKKHNAFLFCKDSFPSEVRSYRQSPTSIVHDSESVFARTFHENPELSVNRSFLLKKDTLEINWRMKNSDKLLVEGYFELKVELASKAKLETQGSKTNLILDNGIKIEIENDKALLVTLEENLLTLKDTVPRSIKSLHRSSQKISFRFSD